MSENGGIEGLIEVYGELASVHQYMPTDCIGEARTELAALRSENAGRLQASIKQAEGITDLRAENEAQARQIAALREVLQELVRAVESTRRDGNVQLTVQWLCDNASRWESAIAGKETV